MGGLASPGSNSRRLPDFRIENALRQQGYKHVAGVDECGRGPLAGPVVAAAVELRAGSTPAGLNDSKKLTAKAREKLYGEIVRVADVGVAFVEVSEIDSVNILNASMKAMRLAAERLPVAPDYILVDGNRIPEGIACPAEALVGGDARSVSISAASIVAKVVRDAYMNRIAFEHPGYGWERNSGYGTREHIGALMSKGPTPHHRRSFAPVRRAAALHAN